MEEIIIREARRTDIPSIIELGVESAVYSQSPFRDTQLDGVQAYRRKDLENLHTIFGQPYLGLFVACQGETFIGHIIILTGAFESVSGEQQGWIIDLSVKPSHQGKGVAGKLLLKAEDFVKQKGLKYMGLGVTSANEKAIRFYEKFGYAEERKRMIKVLQ